jgi:hypothetical protein
MHISGAKPPGPQLTQLESGDGAHCASAPPTCANVSEACAPGPQLTELESEDGAHRGLRPCANVNQECAPGPQLTELEFGDDAHRTPAHAQMSMRNDNVHRRPDQDDLGIATRGGRQGARLRAKKRTLDLAGISVPSGDRAISSFMRKLSILGPRLGHGPSQRWSDGDGDHRRWGETALFGPGGDLRAHWGRKLSILRPRLGHGPI